MTNGTMERMEMGTAARAAAMSRAALAPAAPQSAVFYIIGVVGILLITGRVAVLVARSEIGRQAIS